MVRAAILALALLASAPAFAEAPKCIPVSESGPVLIAKLPKGFEAIQAPELDVPALRGWLEAEGYDVADADGFLAAHHPSGIAVILAVRNGLVCDQQAAVVEGERLTELRELVERWRLRNGVIPPRPETERRA